MPHQVLDCCLKLACCLKSMKRPNLNQSGLLRKKRKFELARPAAMTKLAPQRIHTLRTRGGNKKYRALRLDTGNFAWASEATARKTRIIDVVYNACNNELVRCFNNSHFTSF